MLAIVPGNMNNQDDDKDLFRSLFGDIERVEHDRAPEWRKKPRARLRRDEATADLSAAAISPWQASVDDNAKQSIDSVYQAQGIQHKLMRKLRRGQLQVEASIDLHGMNRVMALDELQSFIAECQQQGITCIHIIHGKGTQSAGGKAVLKPSVASWLRQMPMVLAFSPSLPRDGGEGALYVLLKKR